MLGDYNPEVSKSFRKDMTSNRGATHKYLVTRLVPGTEWPGEQTLVNWCDGGPNNFGGRVIALSEHQREVHVYVD